MKKSAAELPASAQKVLEAARALEFDIDIVEMAESTRTAEEAAAACGCEVEQIVKSLVFRGAASGTPYLMLVAGTHRLNEKSVGEIVGESLVRPDADYVREVTGFAIGGVPPFGHASPMKAYLDDFLLCHDVVWAAAGTPRTVFAVSPLELALVLNAESISVL